MHYLTFIAIDIPQLVEDEAENRKVKETIEYMKKNKPDGKDYLYDIELEELEEGQTTFARAVSQASYEFMEPFGENSEDYQEFFDYTEEFKNIYENDKDDFIKTPDGRIVEPHKVFAGHSFTVYDGKVYEYVSSDTEEKPIRTRLAKKLKALVDYPYKKVYKTFDLFLKETRGDCYNEKENSYGFYFNPNSCYDWCVIGGRWPNTFLVKEDCQEIYLSNESHGYKKETPQGYKWVTAARMKDIEWKLMQELDREEQIKNYQTYKEYFEKDEVPSGSYLKLKGDELYSQGDLLLKKEASLDEFLIQNGISNELKYPSICYGFIFEGEYHQRWVYSTAERSGFDRALIEWQKEVDVYLDSLAPDDVLVSVDIHM